MLPASADPSPSHATSSSAPARGGLRPGWTELVVGVVVVLALEVAVYRMVVATAPDPVFLAMFMTALSAIVAGGGFAAAAVVRIRSWAAFGVRRTTWGWLLVGLAGGVLATPVKVLANQAYVALTGDTTIPQGGWSAAAGGGTGAVILSFLMLAVATPVCEELLFRGVVATALLRYGPIAGVVGSAVFFAVLHGYPILILDALIVGLVAGELRRRSGSVWPGVVLHCAFNLVGSVGLFLLLPA